MNVEDKRNAFLIIFICKLNPEFRTAIRSWPLPVRLWRYQHNRRRLWTTYSERRTPFTSAVCCVMTPSRSGGRIHIYTYFVLQTRISTEGSVHREDECGNIISDANFLIVFWINYGSIVPSFRDTHYLPLGGLTMM